MARPSDSTRRRVSNLVGRFEQLSQSSPAAQHQDAPPTSPTTLRPSSHHSDKPLLPFNDRRTLSLSSFPTTPSQATTLQKELNRNVHLRQEVEMLRHRCHENDQSLINLTQRLEHGAELQQTMHIQTSGLQTKVDRLADKLAKRDRVQKAEYERRIVVVKNERDMLASRLKMTEASVERARMVEEQVKVGDQQVRVAEEKARTAARQVDVLREQLMELKTDLAARSGKRGADVSDQQIFDKLTTLNHMVQNWCVNSFRKVKIDPRRMGYRFEKMEIFHRAKLLRKLYADFDSSIKIFTFQATVVYLLMPVFEKHFWGLPGDLQGLESAARAMQSSTASFSDWRASTAEFLEHSDGDLGEGLHASRNEAQRRLVEQICTNMSALTGTTVSEDQKRTLATIVEHAVSLSRLFGRQRASYRCFLPEVDDQNCLEFEAGTMEDLMDEQEEDGFAKDIKCVVFPALVKRGWEQGENTEVENVLMKAKVLCVEDDTTKEDAMD